MAFTLSNAPRRARFFRADFWHIVRASVRFVTRSADRSPGELPRLNDHMARDIGLSPSDMEYLRARRRALSAFHPRM